MADHFNFSVDSSADHRGARHRPVGQTTAADTSSKTGQRRRFTIIMRNTCVSIGAPASVDGHFVSMATKMSMRCLCRLVTLAQYACSDDLYRVVCSRAECRAQCEDFTTRSYGRRDTRCVYRWGRWSEPVSVTPHRLGHTHACLTNNTWTEEKQQRVVVISELHFAWFRRNSSFSYVVGTKRTELPVTLIERTSRHFNIKITLSSMSICVRWAFTYTAWNMFQ